MSIISMLTICTIILFIFRYCLYAGYLFIIGKFTMPNLSNYIENANYVRSSDGVVCEYSVILKRNVHNPFFFSRNKNC